MIQILEYIVQNYTSFLIILILILLAIIGYYADKTNFGQGKNKEKQVKEKIEENKAKNDIVDKEEITLENIESLNIEEKESHDLAGVKEPEINNFKPEEHDLKEEFEVEETTEIFDEIDSLLPQKELINSDLLNEIEGMELNSLKKKTSFNVPDLDDISLPKIKNLVEKEQDIWKF